MAELLITGGQVIDGTGAPARQADVRIRDGRIVEVGPSLAPGSGETVKADGMIVAPGFIDNHTHYDASLFWDPRCDPMPEHGVTTVLIGNCSLGLAPAKPAGRTEISDVFSFIEDIPRDLFSSLVPWEWEKYDQYAHAMADRKLGVNVVGLVPHSWLRTYIMGDAAWERAATAEEIAAMARELEAALRAGARGLSTSLFDKDSGGRPVPSSFADDAELEAFYRALHATGGIGQLIPRHPKYEDIEVDLRRFGVFSRRYAIPVLINAMTDPIFDSTHAQRLLDLVVELQRSGAPIYPMMAPSSLNIMINFHHTMSFMNLPAWMEVIVAGPDEKRRMLNDPAWRARARNDWDTKESMLFPTSNIGALIIVSVGDVPALAEWVNGKFADIVAQRGGHPSDVLADWVLETNLDGKLIYPITNQRPEVVGKLLRDHGCVIGGSDAGAHFQAFCGAGDTTLLLTRHVRERGDLTIEEAIHGITGRQAEVMGLKDRGVIRPGAVGDIVIFKLEELRWLPPKLVNDVPGGYPRLRRPPGGYRFTIVAGEMVQCHGHATPLLPGRFLGTNDHQQARLAAE